MENEGNVKDESPLRGPVFDGVRGADEIDAKNPAEEKVDFRKVPKDLRPDLEKHHDEILTALRNCETMRVIHQRLKVSRKMLKDYIDKHEDLLEAWGDAKEDFLDLNEEIVSEIATLDCNMIETDAGMFPRYDGRTIASKLNAAKFRLERLGGARGWNAKLETNEVGNGGRIPVIYCGNVSEEDIADAEAMVAKANQEALKGLEGIPHG